MAHISEAPIGGKFRAVAAAALDGVAGTFGDDDLLSVQVNASGELVVGTVADCHGIIWTREGRKGDTPDNNEVIGGRTYTVITRGQIAEMEVGTSPFSAGDRLYSRAAGAVDAGPTGGAGAKYVGVMVSDSVLVVDVGLLTNGVT